MAIQFISKQARVQEALNRRIKRVERLENSDFKDRALQALETGNFPKAQFPDRKVWENQIRVGTRGDAIAEFVGTDNFAKQFVERQRYEVEVGRDMEPTIYDSIYSITVDPTLPQKVSIYRLGTAGVVFEDIKEGQPVKFASVNASDVAVSMVHKGVGLEYTEDLFLYNELFRVANLERQFGVAHNAMLNHVHMDPIINASGLTGNNATDGTALTTFKVSDSLPYKYLRTIEAAIQTASTDKTNPRRGPYALVTSSGDVFTIERALSPVPQEGISSQSSARTRIQRVVEYDGWTGTRGNKQTAYAGVASGTAYLVHIADRMYDFQSYFKHELRRQEDMGDLVRFIMARTVWDVRFGVFADPKRAVHKITWPVAASGAS